MWAEVQVTIVVIWWSIFVISPRVEEVSGIITYIGIYMIANYEFPTYLNIFIHYNDISVIMNSTLYLPHPKGFSGFRKPRFEPRAQS